MSVSIYIRVQIIALLALTSLLNPIACQLNSTNCNRCMDNGIACATETQYYKCQDGKISTDVLHDCPESKICTNALKLCVPRLELEPACPLTNASFCGICAKANTENEVKNERRNSFACVGPNHYKSCHDQMISNEITFNCEPNTICSIKAFEETGKVCVPDSAMNATYIATCLEAPTLLPKELENACSKFEIRGNIMCFNMPNPYDAKCQSFIHCSREDGQLQGQVIKCEQGSFNIDQNKCVPELPLTCGQIAEANETLTTVVTSKKHGMVSSIRRTTPSSALTAIKPTVRDRSRRNLGQGLPITDMGTVATTTTTTPSLEVQNGTLKEETNSTVKPEKKVVHMKRFRVQTLGM